MNEDQIKHMVNRFLCWRLPATFNPDCGITFEPYYNGASGVSMSHEPTGTNVFCYTEAEAMVRHMIEGLPDMVEPDWNNDLFVYWQFSKLNPVAKKAIVAAMKEIKDAPND